MALLDMQGMEPETRRHHGGSGSELSLLLCASEASITLCL